MNWFAFALAVVCVLALVRVVYVIGWDHGYESMRITKQIRQALAIAQRRLQERAAKVFGTPRGEG